MAIGRPPKPTALKLIQGNPGKRPLNDMEPVAGPLLDMKPPTWLDATGRKLWREMAPVIAGMGLLTEADAPAFGLLCQAFSRYRAAQLALRGVKPDDENYRAVAITLEKAEASFRLIAGEFGMTPTSRARLSVGKSQDDIDPMEELLRGRQRA